jgi:hypothetical protein
MPPENVGMARLPLGGGNGVQAPAAIRIETFRPYDIALVSSNPITVFGSAFGACHIYF